MDRTDKFNDALGQHMTPETIARLVARSLPSTVRIAVDLAVGDGALLRGLQTRKSPVTLLGVDCDAHRLEQARTGKVPMQLRHADGLAFPLPRWKQLERGELAILGNPPFLAADPQGEHARWQELAFDDVRSRHGPRRLEMSFLARALVEARQRRGMVAMLMPSPIAAGLLYEPYRRSLLSNFRVQRVVTIDNTRYRDTEASTVLLVIDASRVGSHQVTIDRFSPSEGLTRVYRGPIEPGQRLDAGFWSAIDLHRSGAPTLEQMGVDVTRGRYCKADADRRCHRVLHTTDLSQHQGATIQLPDRVGPSFRDDVLAETGDILLSRTGSRVRWEPVIVAGGTAPITDHVLRIRSPELVRDRVARSFQHPAFPTWLESVTKGVCASVITKRELLQMPIFSN
jgi:hypothetical protein